jgi:hypothetical protein
LHEVICNTSPLQYLFQVDLLDMLQDRFDQVLVPGAVEAELAAGRRRHRIPPEFWEELGRTIATLAFLEDCLKRASLAITATRTYRTVEQAEAAFATWERDLESSLNETLKKLAERMATALKGDERYPTNIVDTIQNGLKRVAERRNALCHGAWVDYDSASGVATLRYWRKKEWRQSTSRCFSTTDLARIRREAVEITYDVIDLVVRQGIQFPGSTAPGKEVRRAFEATESTEPGGSV